MLLNTKYTSESKLLIYNYPLRTKDSNVKQGTIDSPSLALLLLGVVTSKSLLRINSRMKNIIEERQFSSNSSDHGEITQGQTCFRKY